MAVNWDEFKPISQPDEVDWGSFTPVKQPDATVSKQPDENGLTSEMRSYEPTVWDRIKDIVPSNRARASNEVAARAYAKERGVPVEQVYQDVGGSRTSLNPEGRPPVRAFTEGAQVVSKDLPNVLPGFENTILRTIRGGDTDITSDNWIDKEINDTERQPGKDSDPNYAAFENMGQNLAFSFTSMGSAILAGAGTTLATKNPIAGASAGMAASGAMAFRATKDQFLDQVKDHTNSYYKEVYGRDMTQDEWTKAYKMWNSAANKYGAWEAIPEAVSNLITIKIFSAPLKGASNSVVGKISAKAADIVRKTASDLPQELGTETATQMGQNRAEVESGLAQRKIGVGEAFSQVAPATAMTTGAFGGAAAVTPSRGAQQTQKGTQAPPGFTPTHKAAGGIPVMQATGRNGQPIPDQYVDAQGRPHRDAFAQPLSPSQPAPSAGPLDAHAQAESIRAEVFGVPGSHGIINYGNSPATVGASAVQRANEIRQSVIDQATRPIPLAEQSAPIAAISPERAFPAPQGAGVVPTGIIGSPQQTPEPAYFDPRLKRQVFRDRLDYMANQEILYNGGSTQVARPELCRR